MLTTLGTILLGVLAITVLIGVGFLGLFKGAWNLLLKAISGVANAIKGGKKK